MKGVPSVLRTRLPPSPVIACRPFLPDDRAACLALFDSNAPDYFAWNEREDFERYLASAPDSYRVCLQDGEIVGAFGLTVDPESQRGRIRWIMTHAAVRGSGLGTTMMGALLEQARAHGLAVIDIAASQQSAPFFARFGATVRGREPEGWGPGLDRVTMEWHLTESERTPDSSTA